MIVFRNPDRERANQESIGGKHGGADEVDPSQLYNRTHQKETSINADAR